MHLAGPDIFGPLRRSGGKVSQKMKRIARYLLLAVLLWLLFLVLSMVIPPLVHKTAGPGDWEAEPEMTDAAPGAGPEHRRQPGRSAVAAPAH